ncbi:MAG TPA: hypothetical protein VHA78_05195 [Candidatus Peribacteraceae bacterium]|nr:hypothetical protein [Candidatus Peribacteraceae bacterium]
MNTTEQTCDSYVIDTYKSVETGTYIPGAITYCGKKKLEVLHWKDQECESQDEADAFVHRHFHALDIAEAEIAAQPALYRTLTSLRT